ncbi:glycosyltransferase [Myxococcota bacterium]|nr:glycosyltransferase [Myxococcota bacterium]
MTLSRVLDTQRPLTIPIKGRCRADERVRVPLISHLISGDLWAGAEIATLHLLEALNRLAECDVRAVVLNEGTLAGALRKADIETEVVPESSRGFPSLARAVRRALAGSDLVHAHRYKETALAVLSGRPWVATQHGRPEPFSGLGGLRMRAYIGLDLTLKRQLARRVVAVSQEVEDWLRTRIGPGRSIHLGNGIEDPARTISAPDWAKRPGRVGILARLTPVKGIELAIDSLAQTEDLELEIVGDGPLREALEARVRDHGNSLVRRVEFVGFDPAPLPRVANWRALMVTSHHEGHPVSVMESLALGTPVLSGPLRGVEAMLKGEGGWILPDRRPETWSEQLQQMVGLEDRVGNELSHQARSRFTSTFGAERAAQAMLSLYREAMPSHQPAPAARPQREPAASR